MLFVFDANEQLQAVYKPNVEKSTEQAKELKYFLSGNFPALFNRTESQGICPYIEPIHGEKLNGENSFTFSVPASHTDSEYIVEGSLVAFKDLDGNWQLFEIKRITDIHGTNFIRTAFCEHAFYELIDDVITDIRPTDCTANFALTQALSNTRWEVGTVNDLGLNSTTFYYQSSLSSVQKVAKVWKGELRFRVEVIGGIISNRYVDLLARRGAETGKQFAYGQHNKNIEREIDLTTVSTALYGRGKGVEVGDGYGRRLDFSEIVWSVANGDPVDKPQGQEWVGSEDALLRWGRPTNRHRFSVFEDAEETDAATLLQKTWDRLQEVIEPYVVYSLDVLDLEKLSGYEHEKVRLGDTVRVIDRAFNPELLIEARVMELKRNLFKPQDTSVVLGNFPKTLADTSVEQKQVNQVVQDRQGVWDKATNFTPGEIPTNWLDGVIDVLQNQLQATTSNWYTDENGNLIFETIDGTAAMMLTGNGFMLANEKDTNGAWVWRTFGTGDGFTADEFNAGTINTSLIKIMGNSNFYWDGDYLYIVNPDDQNQQIRISKEGIRLSKDGGQTWTVAVGYEGINMLGKSDDGYTQYQGDGVKVYNAFGNLVGHFGSYSRLDPQVATFNRNSTAYGLDGTQVAVDVPRYESFNELAYLGMDKDWSLWSHWGNTTYWQWSQQEGGVFKGKTGAASTYLFDYYPFTTLEKGKSYKFAIYLKADKVIADFLTNFYFRCEGTGTKASQSKTITITKEWQLFEWEVTSTDIDADLGVGLRLDFPDDGLIIYAQKPWLGEVGHYLNPEFGHALFVEEGTTNIAPNPIFSGTEGSLPTGWTEYYGNTTTAISTEKYKGFNVVESYGDGTTNLSTAHGAIESDKIPINDQDYTLSVYMKSQDGIQRGYIGFIGYDSSGTRLGTNYFVAGSITWDTTWTKYEGTTNPITLFGANCTHVSIFVIICYREVGWAYCTLPQLEVKPYSTSFIDGTREYEELVVPTDNVITAQRGTVELWAYITDSTFRTIDGEYPTIFNVTRGDSGIGIWFHHDDDVAQFTFQTRDDSNNATKVDISDADIPNGWHKIDIAWSPTEAKVLCDGVRVVTISSPSLPSSLSPVFTLGCYDGTSTRNGNILVTDFRASADYRTDEELANSYAAGRPLPVDRSTTYKMTFDEHLNTIIKRYGLFLDGGEITVNTRVAGNPAGDLETKTGAQTKVDNHDGNQSPHNLPSYCKMQSDGFKVFDDQDVLRCIMGQYESGKYGVKITEGKIYATSFQSGAEGATDYVRIGSGLSPFSIVKDGEEVMEIYADTSWGAFIEWSDITMGRMGIINPFDDALGNGLRVSAEDGTANGRTLVLDAEMVRTNSPRTFLDWISGDTDITVWGDLHVTGDLSANGSKPARQVTENYGERYLYARESPDVRYIIEDVGQLVNGEYRIDLDPIFLECVETNTDKTPWLVQLTALMEPIPDLYAAEIGATYLIFKEPSGQSNGKFCWSLSAIRKGYAETWLELYTDPGDDEVLTSNWEDEITEGL